MSSCFSNKRLRDLSSRSRDCPYYYERNLLVGGEAAHGGTRFQTDGGPAPKRVWTKRSQALGRMQKQFIFLATQRWSRANELAMKMQGLHRARLRPTAWPRLGR